VLQHRQSQCLITVDDAIAQNDFYPATFPKGGNGNASVAKALKVNIG
jgi:hypothetical protein